MSPIFSNSLAELHDAPPVKTEKIDAELVRSMTREIWTSVLGLSLESVIGPAPSAQQAAYHYAASVRIIGCENLTILFYFPEILGRKIVAGMFNTAEEEVQEDQINDILKELANIMGGNLKGTLNQYHFLSTPSISRMTEDFCPPEGDVLYQYTYKCLDHYLSLSVIERY